MSNNLKVILCASYEDAVNYAKEHNVKATVEAEYGAECMTGSVITPWHITEQEVRIQHLVTGQTFPF